MHSFIPRWRVLLSIGLLTAAAACGVRHARLVPPGTSEPDHFLFDKGTAALNAKKWLTSREFFKQVVETYVQSPYRPDSKLGVKELQTFVDRYPNSSLMPEVRPKLREARDRLSQNDYMVGYFYFRQRWYPGAINRFKSLLDQDPGYTGRDAVYYYLGESLVKQKREAEALPLYEKLVSEFERSEYLVEAQRRIAELKQAQSKPTGG